MNVISRRRFLRSLSSVVLLMLPTFKITKPINVTIEKKTAYLRVYQLWTSSGLGDPVDYIVNRSSEFSKKDKVDADFIKSISENDFRDGRIFDADGMILSRFEAAVIANQARTFIL